MPPLIETLVYQYKKQGSHLELLFRKKDYGSMILYDVFFKNYFLFTISSEGKILMSNWEAARMDPVCLNEDILDEIFNEFIESQKGK